MKIVRRYDGLDEYNLEVRIPQVNWVSECGSIYTTKMVPFNTVVYNGGQLLLDWLWAELFGIDEEVGSLFTLIEF